jgi:tRNA G10  N-methylase Trm11
MSKSLPHNPDTQPGHVLWFLLGREPLLSAAEIAAVFNTRSFEINSPFLKLEINSSFSVSEIPTLMSRLGGTIKIALQMGIQLTEEDLLEKITEELNTVEGKIHFGISLHTDNSGANQVWEWGKEIKQRLKEKDRSVRHVFNRETILSSVSVEKNGLTKRGREFIIIPSDPKTKTYSLAKTMAVQPFEAFGARDFGRPGRDDVSGMLPPKLALMMLNLAQTPMDGTLLDPFCGSGTILTEAWLLGFRNLIGCDISEKAIEDTKKNIEWTAKRELSQNPSNPIFSPRLLALDSTILSSKIKPTSIDTIVAEPFMGKPLKGNESQTDLKIQTEELKKLYLKSFAEFYTVLKSGGRAVFIIPRFKTRICQEWCRIDLLSEVKKLGFSVDQLLPGNDFLLYARPDQWVGREIWRFKK